MRRIIIYATKYGCTEKAAEMLRSKMGGQVDLINVMKERVPPIDKYDNVLIGGSIYVGKIQKEITDYINKNLPLLLKKRVGLFICGGQPEPVCSQELQASFPAELFESAAAKEVFGYEYNFEKLSFLDKLAVRTIAKVTESKFGLLNEKIEGFAKTICASQ